MSRNPSSHGETIRLFVDDAPNRSQFLKNATKEARRVWRELPGRSTNKGGRPSQALLVFYACYGALDSNKDVRSQAEVCWEVHNTLKRYKDHLTNDRPCEHQYRLWFFRKAIVHGDADFAIPTDETIALHVKAWLRWRASAPPCDQEPLDVNPSLGLANDQKNAIAHLPLHLLLVHDFTDSMNTQSLDTSQPPQPFILDEWVTTYTEQRRAIRRIASLKR
jgi:hypothetical protein